MEQSFIPLARNWLVLFPEGGFLRKRRLISKRYAEKNNLPDLSNVSLPRVGALKAIFSVLPPHSDVTSSNNNSEGFTKNAAPLSETSGTSAATEVEKGIYNKLSKW